MLNLLHVLNLYLTRSYTLYILTNYAPHLETSIQFKKINTSTRLKAKHLLKKLLGVGITSVQCYEEAEGNS